MATPILHSFARWLAGRAAQLFARQMIPCGQVRVPAPGPDSMARVEPSFTFSKFIGAVFLTLAALGAAVASDQPEKFSGLLKKPPFGGPASPGLLAGSEPVEFRAVVEEHGHRYFSIFETATRRSTWIDPDRPVDGIAVKSFDAEHSNVTIDYRGTELSLPIQRARSSDNPGSSAAPREGKPPRSRQVGDPRYNPVVMRIFQDERRGRKEQSQPDSAESGRP